MRKPGITRPGGAAALLAMLAGLAIATLGLPAPALAASAAGTGPAKKPDVQALCGTPKKDFATCFALRRTDLSGGLGMKPVVNKVKISKGTTTTADFALNPA